MGVTILIVLAIALWVENTNLKEEIKRQNHLLDQGGFYD